MSAVFDQSTAAEAESDIYINKYIKFLYLWHLTLKRTEERYFFLLFLYFCIETCYWGRKSCATGDRAAGASHTQAKDLMWEKQGAELNQLPAKRTALEDLLGDCFIATEPVDSTRAIHQEIDKYSKETPLPLTSCPLKWWKEKVYSLLAPLAKVYCAVPTTSVPNKHVFLTAGVIVSVCQLLPENVDMLTYLNKTCNCPRLQI